MAEPRLVLITGATKGIGRATARAFTARGDSVIAVARNVDEMDGVFRARAADVTDATSMRALAGAVLDEDGVPDVIVANAGVGLDALFVEMTDDDLARVLDINVLGVVRTIRPFILPMVDRGSGRIIVVSSIVGVRGIPHYAGYSASKFALHGLADALSAELHGTGVSVGVVCPSSTETDFQRNALSSGPSQRRVRPRRHSPESVAKAILKMAGSRRRELVLGAEAKLMAFADRLAPRFVDALLARTLLRR